MGDINLKAALGGQIVLTPTNTAANYTATFPAVTGVVSVQASASYTTGSVLFVNSSGQIAQDNANFFWDDTNNRLGIGTASPSYIISVLNSGSGVIAGFGTNATQGLLTLSYDTSLGESKFEGSAFGTTCLSAPSTNAITFKTNSTEKMRLDASGNLGIGQTSPQSLLDVEKSASGALGAVISVGNLAATAASNECSIGFKASSAFTSGYYSARISSIMGSATVIDNALAFYLYTGVATGGNERMRIDSSGNLLVGTTDSSRASGAGVKIGTPSGRPAGTISCVKTASDSSDDTYNLYSTGAGAYRFYVTTSGVVFATTTTISGISDQRFKENVIDLDVGLDAILSLRPRKFDWKTGKGKDIKGDRGFIAQEFEQVFPDLIDEWKDPPPEGEEPYKSVRQELIPVLVKAIQELSAKLDAAEARIASLEGAK